MIESGPLTTATSVRSDREKMATTLFDTFNVQSLYIVPQSVASLLASGTTLFAAAWLV
jgi:actin-related protein